MNSCRLWAGPQSLASDSSPLGPLPHASAGTNKSNPDSPSLCIGLWISLGQLGLARHPPRNPHVTGLVSSHIYYLQVPTAFLCRDCLPLAQCGDEHSAGLLVSPM